MRNLKVVDFTHGKRDSDEVNTSLPFTENFKECRTIQQANVVIGAYVNQNYKDMQNKQDKLVSGKTIKTINNESILGSGNIEVQAESPSWGNITGNLTDQTDLKNALDNKLTAYDDDLSTTVDEFVKFSGGLSVPASGESAFGKAPKIFADPVNGNDATRKSYVDNAIINNEEVYIGTSEPTNKKLWVKASKNIFNRNWLELTADTRYYTSVNNKIRINTSGKYTISLTKTNDVYGYLTRLRNGVSSDIATFATTITNISTTVDLLVGDLIYIGFRYGDSSINFDTNKIQNIMLNIGDTVIPYEPYINSVINVNNNVGYKKLTDTLTIGTENNNAGLWIKESINKFDKSKAIPNVVIDISNGNLVNATGYNVTDFIYVKDISQIYISGNGDGYYNGAFYDNNKNYVARGQRYGKGSVEVPNNAMYYRGTIEVGKIDTYMLTYGNIDIPYAPYVSPSIKANINGVYETIAQPNIYSSEEIVIGEYLGKPLYRKVLSYNHIGGNTLDYMDITNLNVDKAPRLESSFYSNNSEVVPAPFTNTTGYHFRNYIGGNKNTLTYEVSQLYPSGLVETILEYTKTTDTGVSLLSLDEEE